MTTKSLSPAVKHELIPLGGALVQGVPCKYKIDLVGSRKYGRRPWKQFNSDQVLVDSKNGILQFTARPNDVSQFIWELVLVHDGEGNPVGLHADVYVDAYREAKKFATAHLTGHIITCNNVGPKVGYVIKVQAKSEIEIKYYD